MGFCANCGTRVDAGAAFCENCGARANGQPTRAAYTAAAHPQPADRFSPPQRDARTDAIHLDSWFRGFLIADVVLLVILFSWAFFDKHFLPPALQAYIAASSFTVLQAIGATLTLALLVVQLIAWIGLFLWRRWALHLYLGVIVAVTLLTFATGPAVHTAFASVLGGVEATVEGILLGLGYFSDLRHRFRS